jgi:hypothetical protein
MSAKKAKSAKTTRKAKPASDAKPLDPNSDEYREMQRRLRKLKEAFDAGKIKIMGHLAEGFKESLDKVRFLPNGDIDLATVDGRIRSMALMATWQADRAEIKEKNPLKEIQRVYFDYIYQNFGEYYEVAVRRGLSPHQAGLAASNSQESRDHFTKVIPRFLESIKEIWSYVNDPCSYHLEDLQGLKGVFGGDILPSYSHNIASSCGLYLDTILLPDPFLRMGPLFSRWNDQNRAYYFMKHAMNLLNYRDLALADVEPPIVAVVPDGLFYDPHQSKLVTRLGEADGVAHASVLFGQKFSNYADVVDFTAKLKTTDDLVAAIKAPDRLLFDTEWTGTLAEQIERHRSGPLAKVGMAMPVGQMVAMQCASRMAQANDVLCRSQRFCGVPLVDAPTSWRYLTWKLEYDNRTAHGLDAKATQVVAGLQAAVSGQMRWLGNIPPAALVELRTTGAIEEIRTILREGVSDLETMDEAAFKRGANAVVENLQRAFGAHEEAVAKLQSKKWKFAGKDMGSWIAIGTVEVAAVATGAPLFGLSAFLANQVFDVPKLKELVQTAQALKKEMETLKRSPVGLLFAHKG